MRSAIAALALAMAVTNVHATDNSAKILFAGFMTGVIIAMAADAKKPTTPPPPPVYVPPPPPAPVVTARSKYLEACQAYGFSAGYCVQNWDGKTLQASGL